ncbi:MAG: transcriptional repressor [Eubacterium sp.]|nr:transcriptional repressor [Eubacterium sp.]
MDVPMKKSRQRQAILQCVLSHHDHPTAEIVYQEVRESYPNISLGTVYRNLSLLCRIGKIRRIVHDDHTDRYDGILCPHSHFICLSCGDLQDVDFHLDENCFSTFCHDFDGEPTEYAVIFRGYCRDCQKKSSSLRVASTAGDII